MNTTTDPVAIPTTPGTPFAGGFFVSCLFIDGQLYALIAAPKAEGEREDVHWNESNQMVDNAISFADGLANTNAMAAAGSELAQWARGLRIDGHDDWYLPAQDELELLYRYLKPTAEENTLYARSGVNASAAPATYPYSAANPAQTAAEAFQEGGAEAFAPTWYWSSTQHAADYDYAWHQNFDNGDQTSNHKSYAGRARAVRRLAI